ncbi:MAG: nuclear transport factor 2 family protein, partial [Bdellovibrionota bacterium]
MTIENLNATDAIETVKKIYAALNRNDLSTYLSFFDAKVDRFESFGSRGQGLAELQANFSQGRDKWAEGSCEPEKFTVVNNKVTAFVHVKVRLKDKSDWIDGKVIDVFTFHGAKVTE